MGRSTGIWGIAAVAILGLTGCRHDPPARSSVPLPRSEPRTVAQSARDSGLRLPFRRVFLRVFKREREMELWAGGNRMSPIRTYPIAAMSGGLGPKRRTGDLQAPEGVYRIVRFNPTSHYRLSMGLDYPNRSDRLRGDAHPGSDIYIHGNHVSAGCMAMTDALIDEIYPLCARAGNRRTIPVHIFPARLTRANLAELCARYPQHAAFWRELQPIYDAFERTHVVPGVRIDRTGAYRVERSLSRRAKDNGL